MKKFKDSIITNKLNFDSSDSPESVVKRWVSRISKKHTDLGEHSICPFASTKKLPKMIVVEKLSLDHFQNINNELTIFIETDVNSSYNEIENLCRQLKDLHKNFVFLPDHPHKTSYIKGYETGNGVLPCIIAQTKKELDSARLLLEKTDYYENWDKDYLAEIRSFD